MTRLEKLRKRLGQCDEILLDAILMRHHIIKDIMAYKEENGLNILDPEQEETERMARRSFRGREQCKRSMGYFPCDW